MFTFLKSDVAFKKTKTNQSVHQQGIGLQIIVNPYNFKNEKSKVVGEYVINSISIPLGYNGTMSISANEALNRV